MGMNDDSNRSELNSLKVELERVEADLRFLRAKADRIESRLAAREHAGAQNAILESLVAPPIIATPVEAVPQTMAQTVKPAKEEASAAPPIIQTPVYQDVLSTPPIAPEPPPIRLDPPVFAPQPVLNATQPESFEMRLGTYWFVRIGIVMVLTAMVFLGNYAYQHYVGLLGPLGKVILMYAASAGLMAAGAILPRRQERLKNYGQVLFAGGLAAVYFTTYAAHHFTNLQVITNAVLDGVLLLAWTSFIVWLADRKKSEVLAVFAIGLAYYTALITNVGNFTLVSNLLLAAAAVFFLVRNRWVTLTFLSIAASYGSYFYWRYYAGSIGIEEFAGRLSICGYWTIFTTAVFLTRHVDFTGPRRAGFLSFNNAAAFLLLSFSYLHQRSGNFWELSLAAGGILLVMSFLAVKLIPDDVLPRRAYLAQGLLLTTLGIISKLSGPTLALVLGVESALLLIFATQWKSQMLRIASVIVAALGAGWLLCTLHATDAGAWAKAAGVFALLLFDAFWVGKSDEETDAKTARPLPSYFAGLALLTWIISTFTLAQPFEIAPILAFTTVALTGLHYLLRVREVTFLGQSALAVAQGQMLALLLNKGAANPWHPLCVIAISLGMALWWKRQQAVSIEANARLLLESIGAFAAAFITHVWLPDVVRGETVVTAAWMLTFAWTALGLITRSWPIATAGQIFLIGTTVSRLGAIAQGAPEMATHSIELIGAFIVLAAFTRFFSKRVQHAALDLIPHVYQSIAAILTLTYVCAYVDVRFRFVILTALFVLSLIPAMMNARYTFGPGVFLAISGLFIWLLDWHENGAELQNLVAILAIAGTQIAVRKYPKNLQLSEAFHNLWMAIAAGWLWLFVSRWVIDHSAGAHFYLTASWAILAFILFGVGFALRERVYRWTALTVLACALARVVMLDVWKLETIYRIFSFLALGLVLLALGYVYTRFQEKITRWL
jgi:hypothetical protein